MLKPRQPLAPTGDGWTLNELARCRRLRQDGKRPLGVNLAEGLALTAFLSSFTGVCLR
jgi:hypothetical protein